METPKPCLAELERDALRYRWLRSEAGCDLLHVNSPINEELDKWVDECMARQANQNHASQVR